MQKSKSSLWFPLPVFVGILLSVAACKTVSVQAPAGKVPDRKRLEYDGYGGYITLMTLDSISYSGELIGLRNDSTVVLGDHGVTTIASKHIANAKVVVYNPSSYSGAYAMLIPNVLLIVHVGEFGAGPLALSLLTSAIDLIGIAAARNAERRKTNYYEWSDGWREISKYSRFPGGVPSHVALSTLKSRVSSVTKK